MASSTTSYQQPFTDPQAPKVSASHSKFGTLLSRRLPNYTGRYPVGTLDVEYPFDEPRRVGTFKHRKLHSDAPAGIEVETVLFSIFYPCEVGTDGPGVQWFPRFAPTISGFLEMAGRNSAIYRALASFVAFPAVHGLRFPCYLRAKPLSPSDSKGWPTVVFSHGVGCSRLMYTHICGELASRGYVVIAVEHRDGTGPSAMITTEEGKEREVNFLRWKELDWPDVPPDQQPKDDTTLRHAQLQVRLLELQTAISVLGKIISGELGRGKERVRLQASRTYEWEWWNGMMDLEQIGLAGHSFGGTAALAAAADSRFTPSYLFIMDPAVQRLEPWQGSISCPVLCVNSEEFAKSDDYGRLLGLSKTVKDECHILTIGGTTHPSFSDVFLITPHLVSSQTGLHIPAYEVFQSTLDLADIFCDGEAEERKAKLRKKGRSVTNSLGAGSEKLGRGEIVYQTI